jgi:hypothetical protein
MRIGEPVDVTKYVYPGIYRVDSLKTKRSFFGHAECLLFDMRELVSKLEEGECENEDLQNDFRTYGIDNFQFFALDYGPEFFDSKVREQEVESYKKTWSDGLY